MLRPCCWAAARRVVPFLFAVALASGMAVAQTGDDDVGTGAPPSVEASAVGAPPAASKADERQVVVPLTGNWRMRSDPDDTGRAEGWASATFDDRDWEETRGASPLERQNAPRSGWIWFRQAVTLPAMPRGGAARLVLADFFADDDVFVDGVRIGGLRGDYKYEDRKRRVYAIPAKLLQTAGRKVVAVRLWSGDTLPDKPKPGKPGVPTFRVEIDARPLDVRATDGTAAPVPFDLFDFSDAQRGRPLTFSVRLPRGGVTATYRLTDPYGLEIAAGDARIDRGSGDAVAAFDVGAEASRRIYLAGRFQLAMRTVDGVGAVVEERSFDGSGLDFTRRDTKALPALPARIDDTPYGRLRLVDVVDAATPPDREDHPYLQSAFGERRQTYHTPGARAEVEVRPILGRAAREAHGSWFAYRLGRERLVPGRTYLLRIEYPEDVPRYFPIEIQSGAQYFDTGFATGRVDGGVYWRSRLSGRWETYDVVFPLGGETTGASGVNGSDAADGVWVYVFDKRRDGLAFANFKGGGAVAQIRLYEIDPARNAPRIQLPPAGVPQRVLGFDWERQPTGDAAGLVGYAALMGYSVISPPILKWGDMNYGEPLRGYRNLALDARGYWVTPSSLQPDRPSVHRRFLDATRGSGVDYLPRVEWGGIPQPAPEIQAVATDGRPARPNRFGKTTVDLLDEATFAHFAAYLDREIRPFVEANPQMKGILWRMRKDLLPISYGRADVARFIADTGAALPAGFDRLPPPRVADLVTRPEVSDAYSTWWQERRRDFHARIAALLRSWSPALSVLYFNWDGDKIAFVRPDWRANSFVAALGRKGGEASYREEAENRAAIPGSDYARVITEGDVRSVFGFPHRREARIPDYAMRPSLYETVAGFRPLAPIPALPYAVVPDLFSLFSVNGDLAVAHIPPYDEYGARQPNPRYEAHTMVAGGADWSMEIELLAWFHGDARTLTFTAYTFGRGFADAHRRFAAAFRALPAVPGRLVPQGDPDLAVRIYAPRGIAARWVGIGYKGDHPVTETIRIPAGTGSKLVDLVGADQPRQRRIGESIELRLDLRPMELKAFRLD